MGNWNSKSSELAKRLADETIKNGGLEQIKAPILDCKISSELETTTVQMGGYQTFINYNKFREKDHQVNQWNKSMRKLRKNIKSKKLRQNGLTHIIHTDVTGGKIT